MVLEIVHYYNIKINVKTEKIRKEEKREISRVIKRFKLFH